MYSGLTFLLHPITVIKIRQQVLNDTMSTATTSISTTGNKNTVLQNANAVTKNSTKTNVNMNALHTFENKSYNHQQKVRSMINETLHSPSHSHSHSHSHIERIKVFYRGLPIILSIALPARALYVAVLEESRILISNQLSRFNDRFLFSLSETSITTLSGGIAGGIAGMTAQLLVVPMDVISQKQMVAKDNIPAKIVIRDILCSHEGWKGLYKGFGISIFNALPTGMIWWATYGGMQHRLSEWITFSPYSPLSIHYSDVYKSKSGNEQWKEWIKTGTIQIGSALSAAMVAATLTQPLDVIKTRLQVNAAGGVGVGTYAATSMSTVSSSSLMSVTKELADTSGMRGFFRGTGARTSTMFVWGSVLSSAYEYLKFITRKDDPHRMHL